MHALIQHVINQNHEMVTSLLESDVTAANCTDKTTENRSALHLAVDRADKDMVELLLVAGADPNKQDHSGSSPLHFAALRGDLTLVTVLVSAGAIDISDNSGYGVLHAALASRDEETINYVRSWLHK